METAYQQYGISNGAVALYRCPEERCRGTGRIPAGSGGKVSAMILVWVVVMVLIYASPLVMLAGAAALSDKAWLHAASIVGEESVSWRETWRWAWVELVGAVYLALVATAITIAMAVAAAMMILQNF